MKTWAYKLTGRGVRFVLWFLVWIGSPLFAQTTSIRHLVAPQYPALARRTTISGQVALKAVLDKTGRVRDIKEVSSPHPLLTESATAAVRAWEFSRGADGRVVTIDLIFGFSGKTRETDAITTVKADFDELAVRVFITTDSYPMSDH